MSVQQTKRNGAWVLGAVLAAAVAAAATAHAAPSGDGTPAERGGYLVLAGGCNDCHTPFKMGAHGPEPDMSRMLSGHPHDLVLPPPPKPEGPWIWFGAASNTAFAGPWGVSYTANLTPDPETGLGSWDADTFVRAIRTGKHKGAGREILPPMPWPSMSKLTDEDLRAIFAYLQTVPAIRNQVPEPVIAPPPPAKK
jgi:cytochrome c553